MRVPNSVYRGALPPLVRRHLASSASLTYSTFMMTLVDAETKDSSVAQRNSPVYNDGYVFCFSTSAMLTF